MKCEENRTQSVSECDLSGLGYRRCLRNQHEMKLIFEKKNKNKKLPFNPCARASYFLAPVSGELTVG